MLMLLRQWRRIAEYIPFMQAMQVQIVEWLVFLERSVCGSSPRLLPIRVVSPLGRSRGGRRTRLSVEVPSIKPAQRLSAATHPSPAVPFSE